MCGFETSPTGQTFAGAALGPVMIIFFLGQDECKEEMVDVVDFGDDDEMVEVVDIDKIKPIEPQEPPQDTK